MKKLRLLGLCLSLCLLLSGCAATSTDSPPPEPPTTTASTTIPITIITPKKIIENESASDVVFDFNDFEALTEYSSTILVGKVTALSHTSVQGNDWTVMQVQPERMFKGEVLGDQPLTVYFLTTTAHEIEDWEIVPSEVGGDFLFYLVKTPDDSPLPTGVYERFNMLRVQDDGTFCKADGETYSPEQIQQYIK